MNIKYAHVVNITQKARTSNNATFFSFSFLPCYLKKLVLDLKACFVRSGHNCSTLKVRFIFSQIFFKLKYSASMKIDLKFLL